MLKIPCVLILLCFINVSLAASIYPPTMLKSTVKNLGYSAPTNILSNNYRQHYADAIYEDNFGGTYSEDQGYIQPSLQNNLEGSYFGSNDIYATPYLIASYPYGYQTETTHPKISDNTKPSYMYSNPERYEGHPNDQYKDQYTNPSYQNDGGASYSKVYHSKTHDTPSSPEAKPSEYENVVSISKNLGYSRVKEALSPAYIDSYSRSRYANTAPYTKPSPYANPSPSPSPYDSPSPYAYPSQYAKPSPYDSPSPSPYDSPSQYAYPSPYDSPSKYAKPSPYDSPSPSPYDSPSQYANQSPYDSPAPYDMASSYEKPSYESYPRVTPSPYVIKSPYNTQSTYDSPSFQSSEVYNGPYNSPNSGSVSGAYLEYPNPSEYDMKYQYEIPPKKSSVPYNGQAPSYQNNMGGSYGGSYNQDNFIGAASQYQSNVPYNGDNNGIYSGPINSYHAVSSYDRPPGFFY
jgi:hypothetical protein